MNLIKNNIHLVKIFLKTILSIACYLAFTIYTIPAYNNVRAYVDEKLLTGKKNLVIAETPIVIEIVDTPETRTKGLSGRETFDPNTGMLFVFQEADIHGIWMKDMNFDIDIVWFNTYGEIIHYEQNVSPDTYPKVFEPSQESMYILEVPAGFIKSKGLKLGDKIDLY